MKNPRKELHDVSEDLSHPVKNRRKDSGERADTEAKKNSHRNKEKT